MSASPKPVENQIEHAGATPSSGQTVRGLPHATAAEDSSSSNNPTNASSDSTFDAAPLTESIKHAKPSLTTKMSEDFEILRLWAEQFHDAQKARIASGNRFTAATRLGAPLDPSIVEAISKYSRMVEDQTALPMKRAFRRAAPEIYAWVKETPGLGEHTVARLLGAIGHPCIATPYHWEGEGENRKLIQDEPFMRSVSQLWAYCGVGDATKRRRKGMTAQEVSAAGKPTAKMLIRLISEACIKTLNKTNVSPYRHSYDLARGKYEEREDWTDLHKHNAALRYAGKQFLKDLWVIANDSLARPAAKPI